MRALILTATFFGVFLLPSPCFAAEVTPTQQLAYEEAYHFWGNVPSHCVSVTLHNEGEDPWHEDAAGRATQPDLNAPPVPCDLYFIQDDRGPCYTRLTALHEYGHLLGLDHPEIYYYMRGLFCAPWKTYPYLGRNHGTSNSRIHR